MLVLLYIYIYINSTNTCIPPIMIINRIYENQNLLSLQLVSFLVGLRTYQHPCILFDGENISFDASLVICINSTNIPPIMIINKIYETQNFLLLQLLSFLVGLRTYQHPSILVDGENISFDASLVICINSTNIPPIMIINRVYETQNFLSLQHVSFLVGLRTYQHPCILFDGENISFDASLVIYI